MKPLHLQVEPGQIGNVASVSRSDVQFPNSTREDSVCGCIDRTQQRSRAQSDTTAAVNGNQVLRFFTRLQEHFEAVGLHLFPQALSVQVAP